MKRVILAAILFACIAVVPGRAHATEVGTVRPFGLGIQVFDPTALIGKLFLDRHDAVDFGLGFWGLGPDRCYDANGNWYYCNRSDQFFSVHFDYLYEDLIFENHVLRLDWHAGAGGRMIFNSYRNNTGAHDVALFARVPIGVDFTFRRPSWVEAYVEVAPGLFVFPPLDFWIDVGVGVRAYF